MTEPTGGVALVTELSRRFLAGDGTGAPRLSHPDIRMVLSFDIPFAPVPLVLLTRRADVMGELVNRRPTTVAAAGCALVIIALNIALLAGTL